MPIMWFMIRRKTVCLCKECSVSAPTNVVEKPLITIVMPASSLVDFPSFVKFNEFYRLTTAGWPLNGNGTISGICLMDNNHFINEWREVNSRKWSCHNSFKITPVISTPFKVFRYSFSEPHRYFSIALKESFSSSDRYKIFTSNWLWIEICENLVLSKIDVAMTTINKKLWNW